MPPGAIRCLEQAEGYIELDLPERALQVLLRAPEEVRNAFEWHYLKAEAHRSRCEHETAIVHLERARELRPESIAIFISLGWCYKRTDRLAQAITTLLQADAIARRSHATEHCALVCYNLSCYYSLAREKPLMLQWLKRAIALHGQFAKLVAGEHDFDPYRDDPDFLDAAKGGA